MLVQAYVTYFSLTVFALELGFYIKKLLILYKNVANFSLICQLPMLKLIPVCLFFYLFFASFCLFVSVSAFMFASSSLCLCQFSSVQ